MAEPALIVSTENGHYCPAKDTPGLFGGWVIHKVGVRAPKVMEVARLQAWTLKPAIALDR